MSASSAQAQEEGDCSDAADQAAYTIFELVAAEAFLLDEEFETDPDLKECEKICKTTGKLCETAAKDVTKAQKNILKTFAKAEKTLCASATSEKACKDSVKTDNKSDKDALKQAQKLLEASCDDAALETECKRVCDEETEPATCDVVFGDTPK